MKKQTNNNQMRAYSISLTEYQLALVMELLDGFADSNVGTYETLAKDTANVIRSKYPSFEEEHYQGHVGIQHP